MDDTPHILIVDDDARIRQLLSDYLRRKGLRTTTAADAASAREKMRALAFDLMVLDIMMPGEDGLSFTRALRDEAAHIPILLLSALDQAPDRIAGLSSGSDDYLTKPFEPEELLLRIQALLRRAAPPPQAGHAIVRFGPCRFDMQSGELRRDGELVKLTGREREILRILASRPDRPVPREQLTPPGSGDNPRTVDVQINRLRRKIEADPSAPSLIKTVRGSGYILTSGKQRSHAP